MKIVFCGTVLSAFDTIDNLQRFKNVMLLNMWVICLKEDETYSSCCNSAISS